MSVHVVDLTSTAQRLIATQVVRVTAHVQSDSGETAVVTLHVLGSLTVLDQTPSGATVTANGAEVPGSSIAWSLDLPAGAPVTLTADLQALAEPFGSTAAVLLIVTGPGNTDQTGLGLLIGPSDRRAPVGEYPAYTPEAPVVLLQLTAPFEVQPGAPIPLRMVPVQAWQGTGGLFTRSGLSVSGGPPIQTESGTLGDNLGIQEDDATVSAAETGLLAVRADAYNVTNGWPQTAITLPVGVGVAPPTQSVPSPPAGSSGGTSPTGGLPWWVWLAIGLGGAGLVTGGILAAKRAHARKMGLIR